MIPNEFLASKNIHVTPQPPHLPDLSSFNFSLLSISKVHPKEGHFGAIEDIQTAVTHLLKAIIVSEIRIELTAKLVSLLSLLNLHTSHL